LVNLVFQGNRAILVPLVLKEIVAKKEAWGFQV
jgi:hypothetical protein